MSNDTVFLLMGGAGAAFVIILILYVVLSKRMQGSEYRKIQKQQKGTKQKI